MSWQRYLADDQLNEVRSAIIDAGLNTNSALDALLMGLHPQYRGALVSAPTPNIRLQVELHSMNQVHNLRNGDVPLAQWLSAAIELTSHLPQVDVLEIALETVNGGATAVPAGAAPLTSASPLNRDVSEEAQIAGTDQTLSVNYLKQGVEAAASVVKLLVHRHFGGQPEFQSGDVPQYSNATGWIIAPGLLVTNHHVINARTEHEANATDQDFQLQAEHTSILYDYLETDSASATIKTGAGVLLACDLKLDFAILRIPDGAPQRKALRLRRHPIRKNLQQALGTRVNVLQHPNGDPMRLGFRDNFVVFGDKNSLSYLTDTKSGSSGSPVCDDTWLVAALHSGSRGIGDLDIEIRGRKVRGENFGTPIPRLMDKLEADHPQLYAEIVTGQQ